MAGNDNDNSKWPGDEEDPRLLADAYERIHAARSEMETLNAAVRTFVRKTFQKMARGWSPERNVFVVNLPPAKLSHEGRVSKEIRRLCGKVTEELRAALDYGIMTVAQKTNPDLTAKERRAVCFIVARTKEKFESVATGALTYIPDEVKGLIERLQPYHGNQVLEFVADTSNYSKHRSLPKVKHATKVTIILRDSMDQQTTWDEGDWWVFPAGKGRAFWARAEQSRLIIGKRYDALTVLPICIEHVEMIVNTLEYYLQNGHLPEDN